MQKIMIYKPRQTESFYLKALPICKGYFSDEVVALVRLNIHVASHSRPARQRGNTVLLPPRGRHF